MMHELFSDEFFPHYFIAAKCCAIPKYNRAHKKHCVYNESFPLIPWPLFGNAKSFLLTLAAIPTELMENQRNV